MLCFLAGFIKELMCMKDFKFLVAFAIMVISLASCVENKTEKNKVNSDSAIVNVVDTTIYGVCGEGTMMSTLELIKDDSNTMSILISEEYGGCVLGGLLCGDRMAVTCCKMGDDMVAQKVINLTTLLGRWTSLDRNFTIKDDGHVDSNVAAESRPYTEWAIVNGNLVLNADTFEILTLGADSLVLEDDKGIFAYKRQK